MNERVAKLRQQSVEAEPWLSTERAELMTEFYRSTNTASLSAPVSRALAFKYLLEHQQICINEGELIVGEKGSAPKASPTYPELCCHSLEDLDILDTRDKVWFRVSDEARSLYADELIPFWRGKSIRDLIFEEMTDEWKAAYGAGIFTEFMEQRAPGHTVLDHKIYYKGFLDFKHDIQASLDALDYYNDPDVLAKKEELRAMDIAADAIMHFAERHAERARELAAAEPDDKRRAELEELARICSRVPAHAPRNFWEALQAYWFVHLGVTIELNTWDAFNPGRLDQHLYPFYKRELEAGTLTRERARELLQCFWVKFNNQPAPPKVGVTAEESATYTDFANINVGGVIPEGLDGVNEVSYLLLDVIDELRLVQPSTNIQLSRKSPDRFLKRALRIIRQGWGQPSVFNADEVVEELLRQGKRLEDARSGGTSGCVETGAFGKEAYILTGYLNLLKILEVTLYNGVDPQTGRQLGPETGDPRDFQSFDDLFAAYRRQLEYFINVKIRGNNVIERLYATYMPSPFLSIVISDCIQSGVDYNAGGARYNTNYIQGVGIGSLTDSMTALKYHVFDRQDVTMDRMLAALRTDFAEDERLRQLLLNKTPKYGNDEPYADDLMVALFTAFYELVDGRPTTKGGRYRINMLPTTSHIYFGSVVGGMPDGRLASRPTSEGISPVQGADTHGPTAVIRSVSKMDHVRTGGTLLNMKFTPDLLADEEGLDKLARLIRTYFKFDGHHVQFNVVSADTLREAQENPEDHRDLIVRVAGYSDYFTDLAKDLQNEIIARTEHTGF